MMRILRKNMDNRIVNSLVWRVTLYGEETWILRMEDEDRLQEFEMGVWRRTERVPST
jgi:hypothetical protein